MPRPMPHRSSPSERGSGLLSTVLGLTMCLVLLLFAAHTLLALHTRSVVSAAAEEGARLVAHSASEPGMLVPEAERRVRALLGRLPSALAWRVDDEAVVLEITARAPQVLRGVPMLEGLRTVRRAARVRREVWR